MRKLDYDCAAVRARTHLPPPEMERDDSGAVGGVEPFLKTDEQISYYSQCCAGRNRYLRPPSSGRGRSSSGLLLLLLPYVEPIGTINHAMDMFVCRQFY